MALSDYDDEAISGTAECIRDPQNDYDQALRAIHDWYLIHYQRGVHPPVPTALLHRFQALAESDADFTEAVEITIHLAYLAVHPNAEGIGATFQALRVAGIITRFMT